MNAAAQILLKQLKYQQEQEASLKQRVDDCNVEISILGGELTLITQSILELETAIQILSQGTKENVKGHKSKKEKK